MSLVDLGKKLLDSARIGESEDVRLLMSNGAPFTTDWLGASPLHLATQGGHIETVAVLLRAGISWDARTKLDRTSLHVAAQEGQTEIVQLLLSSGADLEAKDMLKMTPLHWAVQRNHRETVDLLLRHNAQVSVKNKFDKTPMDIALDNKNCTIYDILENYSILKDDPLMKADKIELAHLPTSDSTAEIVTSNILHVNKSALQVNDKSSKHSYSKAASSSKKTVPINLKRHSKCQQNNGDAAPSEVQTSTSVLATLAALAEATASKSDGTIDGASWLQDHGITMLPVDNSTVVASALEGGQSLALTEAGKLALSWTKSKSIDHASSQNNSSSPNQKVITIVTDQSEIPSIMDSSNGDAPILLMSEDNSETFTIYEDKDCSRSPAKKLKSTNVSQIKTFLNEKEKLERELEEAKKVVEQYKAELIKKEHEAEEYKKKLDQISLPK